MRDGRKPALSRTLRGRRISRIAAETALGAKLRSQTGSGSPEAQRRVVGLHSVQ
jgi:hypothetical protein